MKAKGVAAQSSLIEVPKGMAHLPRDPAHGNLPVPWFAAWLADANGVKRPDFRVLKPGAAIEAHTRSICFICGRPLEPIRNALVAGPMCLITRVSSEPRSHLRCARYASRVCPFLVTAARKRNPKGLPGESQAPVGLHSPANPGACAVLVVDVPPVYCDDGLFRIEKIAAVEFYSAGKRIFAAPVLDFMTTGLIKVLKGEPHMARQIIENTLLACREAFPDDPETAFRTIIGGVREASNQERAA
jgi:hypothetical protein